MINIQATTRLLSTLSEVYTTNGVHTSREKLNALMLDAELGKRNATVPFPVSLGTCVLDSDAYKKVQSDIQIILSAAMKARRLYAQGDERVQKIISLSPEERTLLLKEPNSLDRVGIARFDFFPTEQGWLLTEFNTDNPDIVMVSNAAVASIYDKFFPQNVRELLCPQQDNTELLLRALQKAASQKIQRIGIIGPLDRWIIGENNKSVEAFLSRGYDAFTGDVSDVMYKDGVVSVRGNRVDVLRRVAETHFFLEEKKSIQPLLDALEDGKISIANSLWDRVLGHKSMFALFSDSAYQDIFSTEELEVLRRCIPWTRILQECETQAWNGETIDLLSFAFVHQKELVLKPAGGAEARGVYIGSDVPVSTWRQYIEEALRSPEAWIIQQRIWPQRFPVLVDKNDALSMQDAIGDISIHTFGAPVDIEFGLIFSRYSFGAINNIISGGGIIFPFEQI